MFSEYGASVTLERFAVAIVLVTGAIPTGFSKEFSSSGLLEVRTVKPPLEAMLS